MRVKKVAMSNVILGRLLRGSEEGCFTSDLPDDVVVVSISSSDRARVFDVVFTSQRWDDVPNGSLIPEINPTYRYLENEDRLALRKLLHQEKA